jgi:hypothetical protein
MKGCGAGQKKATAKFSAHFESATLIEKLPIGKSGYERACCGPHYHDDVFLQMDIVGVGSLPVVLLTGGLAVASSRFKWRDVRPRIRCAGWAQYTSTFSPVL